VTPNANVTDPRSVASPCARCHADVDGDRLVVCAGCRARHHPSCWLESGSCAHCGGQSGRGAPRPSLKNVVAGASLILYALAHGFYSFAVLALPLTSPGGALSAAGILIFGLAGLRTLRFGARPIFREGLAPLHYSAKAALGIYVLALGATLSAIFEASSPGIGTALPFMAASFVLLRTAVREGRRGDRWYPTVLA
jgi:hypothetical protein